MAVIHIYLKHGNVSCTTKEPFIGKEKRLLKFPSWTELFSNNISSVVFKLPSLLKTGNPKIICFGLLSFMLGKYYKQRVPKRLDSFLDSQEDKNLFFIGGSVGAQIVEFHYARKGDVIIEGTETINLIAKNNKTLNRSLSQIQPTKIKKRIFIVGLFSFDLLCYLRKKYPLADMELRYFDILPENKINDFIRIKDFSFANNIKLSVYDRATSSRFQLPYEMSKVNTSKLINFLNNNKRYDVCFLAAYSPDREKYLRPLLRTLKKASLNVKLLLVDFPHSNLEGFRVDTEIMSYEKYLTLVGESRAVIDLWRLAPDEGYSFRISEAFALHTKVITNRTCILNKPFYDDTRLFVFSEATHIEPEIIKRFLVSPMKPVEESIFSLGTK